MKQYCIPCTTEVCNVTLAYTLKLLHVYVATMHMHAERTSFVNHFITNPTHLSHFNAMHLHIAKILQNPACGNISIYCRPAMINAYDNINQAAH